MNSQNKILFVTTILFGLCLYLLLSLISKPLAALGALTGSLSSDLVIAVMYLIFFGELPKYLRALLAVIKLPMVAGVCYLAQQQGSAFTIGFLLGFGCFIPGAFASTWALKR